MKKLHFVLISTFFCSTLSFGSNNAIPVPTNLVITTSDTLPETTERKSFYIESDFQVHSLAQSGNVMFGPNLMYVFNGTNSFGVRALLSVGSRGTYSASALYRHALSENKSRLFLEPSFSYNLVNYNQSVISGGFAIGFQHKLTQEISILATAGLEGYSTDSLISAAIKVGALYLSPKTSVALGIEF